MEKREVSTSPRALQRIAFAAVVLFGLGITYAIHITSQTVSDVKAKHHSQIVEGLKQR